VLGFRAPTAFQVPAGEALVVDFRTTCSVGLLTPEGLIEAGRNITFTVRGGLSGVARYDQGEVVFRAFPLIPPDYDIA
jgi:hypothetical protein